MARSNIPSLLNPPRPVVDVPAPPTDPCPDCGCAEWAWDDVEWYCAICHMDLDEPTVEQRRDEWLSWGEAHGFPRLPYAFQRDTYLKRDVYWAAIAAGEAHWRTFMQRADDATLTLVAQAAQRYTAQTQRKEAA